MYSMKIIIFLAFAIYIFNSIISIFVRLVVLEHWMTEKNVKKGFVYIKYINEY